MKISIEGNIGSGKTTLLTKLCNDLRHPVFLEPVNDWKDWLSLFYRDPSRWGMSFNIKVLLSFNQWKNNNFLSFYERSPISNRFVFSELQYDQGRMTEIELKLFEDVYRQLAWTPNVIIYIRTDPDISMERMKIRARDCESAVPLEYIKAVHDKYEMLLSTEYLQSKYAGEQKCKIIIIDGNKNEDDVYEQVLNALDSCLRL